MPSFELELESELRSAELKSGTKSLMSLYTVYSRLTVRVHDDHMVQNAVHNVLWNAVEFTSSELELELNCKNGTDSSSGPNK